MFRAAGMGRQPPPGLGSCPLKALIGRVKASSPASRYEAPRAEGDWLGRALRRSSALQDNGASERCGEPGKNLATLSTAQLGLAAQGKRCGTAELPLSFLRMASSLEHPFPPVLTP